jgi:protein-tyrosine phosphatase
MVKAEDGMDPLPGWRARWVRLHMLPFGPEPDDLELSWIVGERIAISAVPPVSLVPRLAGRGVTHIVNCRSRAQVRWAGDLAAERAAFGADQVAHAPLVDHGRRQRPAAWAPAARFAARVLAEQPQAGMLVHCSAGRRRSAMLAYAVLRLRGHSRDDAAALVLTHRTQAELDPAYVRSVERWLTATTADVTHSDSQ